MEIKHEESGEEWMRTLLSSWNRDRQMNYDYNTFYLLLISPKNVTRRRRRKKASAKWIMRNISMKERPWFTRVSLGSQSLNRYFHCSKYNLPESRNIYKQDNGRRRWLSFSVRSSFCCSFYATFIVTFSVSIPTFIDYVPDAWIYFFICRLSVLPFLVYWLFFSPLCFSGRTRSVKITQMFEFHYFIFGLLKCFSWTYVIPE